MVQRRISCLKWQGKLMRESGLDPRPCQYTDDVHVTLRACGTIYYTAQALQWEKLVSFLASLFTMCVALKSYSISKPQFSHLEMRGEILRVVKVLRVVRNK